MLNVTSTPKHNYLSAVWADGFSYKSVLRPCLLAVWEGDVVPQDDGGHYHLDLSCGEETPRTRKLAKAKGQVLRPRTHELMTLAGIAIGRLTHVVEPQAVEALRFWVVLRVSGDGAGCHRDETACRNHCAV